MFSPKSVYVLFPFFSLSRARFSIYSLNIFLRSLKARKYEKKASLRRRAGVDFILFLHSNVLVGWKEEGVRGT